MKDEKSKQSPTTTSIGVRTTAEEIFFTVGGEDYRMSAEDVIQVLDFKARREALQREKEEGPVFTLERFILIRRLLKKGLNFPQMQPVFGMPIDELKTGYFKAEKKYDGTEILDQELTRSLDDGEKDYVKRVPIKDEFGRARDAGEKLISLPHLRLALREANLREVAKRWNLDYADFKDFYDKNEKYLKHLK